MLGTASCIRQGASCRTICYRLITSLVHLHARFVRVAECTRQMMSMTVAELSQTHRELKHQQACCGEDQRGHGASLCEGQQPATGSAGPPGHTAPPQHGLPPLQHALQSPLPCHAPDRFDGWALQQLHMLGVPLRLLLLLLLLLAAAAASGEGHGAEALALVLRSSLALQVAATAAAWSSDARPPQASWF